MRKLNILPKLGPSGHCAQPNDYNSLSRRAPIPTALPQTQTHAPTNTLKPLSHAPQNPSPSSSLPPPPTLPPKQVIGAIDGSGRIRLVDRASPGAAPAVDLDLDQVLGKMPNKTFEFKRRSPNLAPLELPADASPMAVLERVLRLPGVGSKRFLTTKVDRHVTGAPCVCCLLMFYCSLLFWLFVHVDVLAVCGACRACVRAEFVLVMSSSQKGAARDAQKDSMLILRPQTGADKLSNNTKICSEVPPPFYLPCVALPVLLFPCAASNQPNASI